jgi:hypothetical protein
MLLRDGNRRLLIRCRAGASVNVSRAGFSKLVPADGGPCKPDLNALSQPSFLPRRPAACNRNKFRLVMSVSQPCRRMRTLPLVALRA